MMSVKRPKSIIAEYSGKGSSQPDPRLKALLDEAARMQQCIQQIGNNLSGQAQRVEGEKI